MNVIRKKKKIKPVDFALDCFIYIILFAVAIVTLYPMWHVVVASFSSSVDLALGGGFLLWPKKFVYDAYALVFENELLLSGFLNSVKILLISLPINIVMTLLCGYFLAQENMALKKPIVFVILLTMYFGGGMIPNYLNIKSLGLYDSIWSLVLPGALSVYNAIICKTAIEGLPKSLTESAYLDGANDFQVIFKIVVPLIKATLAVLLLYYGVAHWNSWFNASIYLKSESKLPVQNVIRYILTVNNPINGQEADVYNEYAETIKYAAIVVTTVPILCVYPFLQKHFTKGVMIGAVKG